MSRHSFTKGIDSLTVQELIDMLQDFAADGCGDCKIVMTANYGDHCHTEQALGIKSVERVALEESGYSHSGFSVCEMPEKESNLNVVALRS